MQIGDQVKILRGVDAGKVGRVHDILPGRHSGRWPYYLRVRLGAGRVIGATINRVEPYTPDEPLGNYWEQRGPMGR